MVDYSLHEYDLSISNSLLKLLKEVDSEFTPPLHVMLNLEDYAVKMATKAVVWMARCDNVEVGFAACYVNKAPQYSFWTMMAIHKQYRNRLIAFQLEPKLIAYCKNYGSLGIQAEVNAANTDLIKLHEHFGFKKMATPRSKNQQTIIDLQLTF